MTGSGRNLIVLSDGTGNSAAAASKTNVWRLYQALDAADGTQIAAFSDGVGTSNIKPLRILGQALGVGVQLNVLRLYKFLCRNYVPGDQIWAFGFSRGAFTIRVLVGLSAARRLSLRCSSGSLQSGRCRHGSGDGRRRLKLDGSCSFLW